VHELAARRPGGPGQLALPALLPEHKSAGRGHRRAASSNWMPVTTPLARRDSCGASRA
jgi:hypothetical protein